VNHRASAVPELAANLRELRERSGHTLRELERMTFISDSALSRYLNGKAVPPWRVLEVLCEVAGAEPDRYRRLWAEARAASRGSRRATPETPEPLHVARQMHATLADAITVIADRADTVVDRVPADDGATLQALRDIQSASRDARRYLEAAEAVLRPQQSPE
jgi:transcriptional regulator with XRE-family HTH domain